MADHQVLYRRWRPLTFSEVVGQEMVVTALRNQVKQGRLSHAYLFCGSRGTGKTSCAKILARAANCTDPRDGDACGECESCRRMGDESSFDILEYDAASNSKVEQMREILESVQYPPQFGRYKVFIIDEVHMLTNNAFNALLKTLEEPPAYMIFILATTEPHKVPATILSRCQRYDFGRIPAAQIRDRLRQAADREGITSTDGALMQIARAAEGGMRDALSILDMCIGYGQDVDETLVSHVLGTSDRSFLFRFTEGLVNEDAEEVIRCVDELMNAGHEPAVFARELAGHLRLLLVARCAPDHLADMMDLSDDAAQQYIGQAQTASESRLMSMLDIFLGVDGALRYAASPRFALESAALHACLRTGETDTAALLDRVRELESALRDLKGRIESGAIQTRVPAPAEKPADAPAPTETKQGTSPEQTADKTMTQIWKQAIAGLAKTDPGLFALANQIRLVSAEDYTFRWAPASEDSAAAGFFTRPERAARMEEVLTMAAGEQCRFVPEHRERAEQPRSAQSMDDLFETFGRENVIVQDS